MSKIKILSKKGKVAALASGAAVAATLATAPVAGATPAAVPAQPPAGGQLQGDSPVPGQPNATLGHSKPDSVTTTHQNGETRVTYYWRWEIKALHALYLPAFHGTPDTPYLATTGEARAWDDSANFRSGDKYIADMKVEPSEGVGYGSFTASNSMTPGADKRTQPTTGWPEGTLFSNNVAAGFSDGEFKLWATFTSDAGDYAHSARTVLSADTTNKWAVNTFPWNHTYEV